MIIYVIKNVFFLLFLAPKPYHIVAEKRQEKTLRRNLVVNGGLKRGFKYSLAIPVILHGSAQSSKVSLSDKIPQ